MRGKEHRTFEASHASRITPAYAGKSLRFQAAFCCIWDHPRLCGEKADENVKSWLSRGITPAYAGKSQSKGNAACVRKDHPRLCGEKDRIGTQRPCPLGSPPPMRGKENDSFCASVQIWITPAYAGKSLTVL